MERPSKEDIGWVIIWTMIAALIFGMFWFILEGAKNGKF